MTTTDESPTPPALRLEPIAPGARLLHIGIPKTGTTAIQSAAHFRRAKLAEHGVCYPGRSFNHREQAGALMGRRHGWSAPGAPSIELWNDLMDGLRKHPGQRGFVSHEFIAECDDDQAKRFVEELGPDLHVVVSLRGFADVLGSSWQQYVKAGNRFTYPRFLKMALSEPPNPKLPSTFYKRNDQAAIVARWVRLVGPERLTVIIADKRQPTQLTDAVEDLLGLPTGMLVDDKRGGFASNRTLSFAEAELIRGLNTVVRKNAVHWDDWEALVRRGAIARLQDVRRPAPDEPGLVLPRWAARRAQIKAEAYKEAVVASGARIVGDPSVLHRPVDTVRTVPTVESIPLDVAVQALAGMLSAATGQKSTFEGIPEHFDAGAGSRLVEGERGRQWLRSYAASSRFSTGDLAGAVVLRGVDQLKSLRRRRRR